MRRHILCLALFLLFVSPVFAQNLTIVASVNGSTTFINSRQNLTVFNISVIPQNSAANITGLNVTINSASSGNVSGNISKVHVLNNSIAGLFLGTNSSINPNLTSGDKIFVSFSTPLIVGSASRTGLFVVFELSNVTRGVTIGGNMTSANDIASNLTVIANVSLPNFTVATTRDLRANASLSPRFVDTSVVNQTFVYVATHVGRDNISTLLVQVPSGFTNISIQNITYDNTNSSGSISSKVDGSVINVTSSTPTSSRIEVYFTANTSSTSTGGVLFPSFVYGGGIDNFTVDPVGNQTNVTTQPLLNTSDVKILKSTAIVNGTDFWEFNFTLNYTATISSGGLIQFKLTNWTNSANQTMSIFDSGCSGSRCATLRNEATFNTTGKFNVTNDYESFTKGISVSSITQASLTSFTLRMIVPPGTPISSSWQTTYTFLFRAYP